MRKISSLVNNKNFLLLLVSDFGLVLFSIFFSSFIRYEFQIFNEFILKFGLIHGFLFVSLKIISFRFFGLYRGMWRYTSVWDLFNIIKANILSSTLIIFSIYLLIGFEGLSRSVFLIDFIICVVMISLSRLGIRVFFSHILTSMKVSYDESIKKKILLIGAGDTGQLILHQILFKHRKKYEVVGFLDDDLKKIKSSCHYLVMTLLLHSLNLIKNME